MSPETPRPDPSLVDKDWGAESGKKTGKQSETEAAVAELQEIEKERVKLEAEGKWKPAEKPKPPMSETEAAVAELQEIEKERIKLEAEGKWKPAEKPKSEVDQALDEVRQMEKDRVAREKAASEYEQKLLAQGWVKGEVRGRGILYPNAESQKFDNEFRALLAERLKAAPDKLDEIDKKIEQMKGAGMNAETFARYQAEAGDYEGAMANLSKSESPYSQSKGYARIAEYQMEEGIDPTDALKRAREATANIKAEDEGRGPREVAIERLATIEKKNQARLAREAGKKARSEAMGRRVDAAMAEEDRQTAEAAKKTEAKPEEIWEEVDVSDIMSEEPEETRIEVEDSDIVSETAAEERAEIPESPEMLVMREQSQGLHRRIEALTQADPKTLPNGERGRAKELEVLNDMLDVVQNRMVSQIEKEAAEEARKARIEAMGKRVDAAMAREDRGVALSDVDRSYEDKIAAAEAAAAKAQDAFADQVQGVLEELDNVPLGPNMKKVLEGSPEAKAAAEARQKLDALKQDREAARNKVREQFPMPEEEAPIEVTDDMIVEIRDLTPEEMKEAKAVAEKNELSPERKKSVEAEIKKTQDEIWNIENGIEIIDRETGKTEVKRGIKELEKKLKDFGLDADEMLEKKALSRWESFKLGLRAMVKPELRRTISEYQKRLDEHGEATDRLNLSKLELKNPKAYAEYTQRRLFRTLLAGARRKTAGPPPTAGFLNLKF